MELVATYPILYRSHQYEVGDSLPADDESMVQAWLDAGTAVWSEGKQEKAKRLLPPPQQDWQGNPRTEKPRRM